MAKFIRLKDSIINIDKVQDFKLDIDEIWVYFERKDPDVITYSSAKEARLAFEDILHLIDNSYIPSWVRSGNDGATCRPEYFNDSCYDELPF